MLAFHPFARMRFSDLDIPRVSAPNFFVGGLIMVWPIVARSYIRGNRKACRSSLRVFPNGTR